MHVPMAIIPPIRLFGKTPSVSVTRPANAAILIKFEAIVSLPVIQLGCCPSCFAVALSKNKERQKRKRPKDQRRAEPCLGRSATVPSHIVCRRHRGHREKLED
jgi:hypothetical protein